MRAAISVVALAAALTGCAATGIAPGGAVGNAKPATATSVIDRFQVPSGFGEKKVALLMSVGTKPFVESGKFVESFSVLPIARKGSSEYSDTMALMGNVGEFLGKNRDLKAYIYTPATLLADESVLTYQRALEAKAGKGRVDIKADARLANVKTPVLWIENPKLAAAQDALLSMEKRGLAATVLQ